MKSQDIYQLDVELLAMILSFRPVIEILNFCLTSKTLYDQLCSREVFWEHIYLLKRENQGQSAEKIIPEGTWKNNVIALELDVRLGSPFGPYVNFDHPIYRLSEAVRDYPQQLGIFYVYVDPKDLNARLKEYYEEINPEVDPVYIDAETPIVFTFLTLIPDFEENPYDEPEFLFLVEGGEVNSAPAKISEASEDFYERMDSSFLDLWDRDGFPIEYENYPIYYQNPEEFNLDATELSDALKMGDFLGSNQLFYVTTLKEFEEYKQMTQLIERAVQV